MSIKRIHRHATGFTIIESMIALAVTGMLVVSAFSLISGRSRHVTFQQAVNDLAGQINKTINEVQVGYNGFENISCEVTARVKTISAITTPTTPPANGLDANDDCIFIGKILQFNADTTAENMRTVSVIGTRLYEQPGSSLTKAFQRAVVNLEESDPVLAIPPGAASGLYDSVKRTPWGLELQEDSNPLEPTAFFIMQSLAPEGTSFVLNNRYATAEDIGVGAQNLYIVPMTASNFGDSTIRALEYELEQLSAGKPVEPLKEPLVLCFKDPARDKQYARIIVGPQTGDTADPDATFTGYGVTTEFTSTC